MRETFVIIFTLIGFLTFGQENNLDPIDNKVNSIESDSTLTETEFDWVELTGIASDGGGILKVWRNEKKICKIVEEIGLSYGRIRTIIYLKNGIPIKIIETEENFEIKDNELNYKKLNEVYREIIYVFDWENDSAEIKRIGKRKMSEQSCSMYELAESVMVRAKKATTE
ncbi:hypothetical protein [Mariniflexile sp. AS56]|uniref:hypothetical protein n=1 Tax=Mariniflexile sp. AS56 TaxID=3063957 RepID=UPI0026E99568|nr:hypothetical protein [Mariniflexile sp. AS56]MDO7174244.1 hypothetical protein [Mariniflexile sp. AS56]